MAKIDITTFIGNKPEIVFDLARSIDLHKISTAKTNEKAVDGVTEGLIRMGEFVTWQAHHLFGLRNFTSKIISYNYPFSFTDEMQKGDLKYFCHKHSFARSNNGTIMNDVIILEAHYGLLGKWVMQLFLRKYFERFLVERNNIVKEFAESDKWRALLKNEYLY